MHRRPSGNPLRFISVVLLLLLSALQVYKAFGAPPSDVETPQAVNIADVIEKYRSIIQEQMQAQRIPGFAIVLVDGENVMWSEGFGCTDWSCETRVTPETPFSIQSMSKSFTAAAVLLAVQDGLLDLDALVSQYLPDYQVNSLFDERPQNTITLRMLLSHTAGFTHEAPVGNNFDLEPGDWESHVASISETWLKFPVGRSWAYSNLGIDLAGYIVEKASGVPFAEYVQTRLLTPLGMVNSTFDIARIAGLPERAIGQSPIFRKAPLVTIMPAGGLYSSADDLGRYLQFHLNRGMASGMQVLDAPLVNLMAQPQFQASAQASYGLGLGAAPGKYGALKVSHGGGGFGFLSMMTWYPALDLGVAWLSNSSEHDLQSWLADDILEDVIATDAKTYLERARSQPYRPPEVPETPTALTEDQLAEIVRSKALAASPQAMGRWLDYSGMYGVAVWGRITELVGVTEEDQLFYNNRPMTEVEPGLFFSADGEALDFRAKLPTWRNIELKRLDFAIWVNLLILGACGLIFLAAIPWAIAGAVSGYRRRRKSPDATRPRFAWVATALPVTLILASVAALLTLALLVKYPFLLFGGIPFPNNPLLDAMERFGSSLPYAAAGLGLFSAVFLALAWKGKVRPAWWLEWATTTFSALVIFCLLVIF